MVATYGSVFHLGSPALAFTVMDCINQCSVVPVLDHIVRAIVDFNLYGVATVVDQENDRFLPTSKHR